MNMISWNEITKVVEDAAPVLGAAISASNPVAGMAISLISQVFGANKNDTDDIFNKIHADPEYKLKLKKIEYDHQDALQTAANENYKIEVDDRKNARDLQIEAHSFIPTFLAIGFFITYAVIQAYCLTHLSQNTDIISARINDGLMLILSYYFGSNHKNSFNPKG